MLERVQDRSWLRALDADAAIRLHGGQKALAQWSIVDDYHTILDLRCQDARLLQYFLQRFSLRACGIADTVEKARALRGDAPDAEIFSARREDIPWRSGSFDEVFYQLPKNAVKAEMPFMQEAARVLKQGGQLLIALEGWPEIVRRAASAAGLTDTEPQNAPQTLLKCMENAGLSDVSYRMAQPFIGVAIGWKRA